jgi:Transglutaminase-like superfamily
MLIFKLKKKLKPVQNIWSESTQNHCWLCLGMTITFAGLTLLQLLALKNLDYTTSQLQTIAPEVAEQPPGSASFQMGSIKWNLDLYRKSPKLQLFREYFHKYCDGQIGLSAALCVSNELAKQIPFGNPTDEFLSVNFEPMTSFQQHLNGEPGHCVTLSGFLAATLLSVGIPARVVQLVPRDTSGHSIVEVWDEDGGWLVVDTTYGGSIGNQDRPVSALAAWSDPRSVRWLGGGKASAPPRYNYQMLYEGEDAPLFRGHLMYPEPWLYLRIGDRASSWPFRGQFLHIGPWQWKFGPAQSLLRWGIFVCSLFAFFSIAMAIFMQFFNLYNKLSNKLSNKQASLPANGEN